MSLRVAREAPEEVVVWRRRRRISIRAADLVGAEVARPAWSRVVARGAGFGVAEHNCYQQQTLARSLHGFSRRATAAEPRSWVIEPEARVFNCLVL